MMFRGKQKGQKSPAIEFQFKKTVNTKKYRIQYFVFKGTDMESSRKFLSENKIMTPFIYIVIKTPTGTLSSGIDGIEEIPVMEY